MCVDDFLCLTHGVFGQSALLADVQHGHRREQRRDEERPVFEHQLDRFVVEIDAVFDRMHASPQGILDAVDPLRMSHHFRPSAVRGFAYDDVQFLGRELREFGMIRRTQHPAGRAHLDHVGARAQHFAHFLPNAVDAVAAAVRKTGIRREQPELIA